MRNRRSALPKNTWGMGDGPVHYPLSNRFQPLRIREITALVMPANGVTNGPCNNNNPSYITACLGDTAALTLSCVPPGQDKGVAPPGRRLPSPLPTRQGKWPFYAILPTPREARTGETQIPFGGRRSHRAAAQTVADRHQLITAPRAAAAA